MAKIDSTWVQVDANILTTGVEEYHKKTQGGWQVLYVDSSTGVPESGGFIPDPKHEMVPSVTDDD